MKLFLAIYDVISTIWHAFDWKTRAVEAEEKLMWAKYEETQE